MSTALFVGSFDPFTIGHLEIVHKAIALCDTLIIGIGDNGGKKRTYDKKQMLLAIQKTLSNEIKQNRVEIIDYEGVTGELAKKFSVNFLVRGIRNIKDFEYEEELANLNKYFFDIDTIYVRADKYPLISSTIVKELIKANKDVHNFVPKEVCELIMKEKNNEDYRLNK